MSTNKTQFTLLIVACHHQLLEQSIIKHNIIAWGHGARGGVAQRCTQGGGGGGDKDRRLGVNDPLSALSAHAGRLALALNCPHFITMGYRGIKAPPKRPQERRQFDKLRDMPGTVLAVQRTARTPPPLHHRRRNANIVSAIEDQQLVLVRCIEERTRSNLLSTRQTVSYIDVDDLSHWWA